MVAVRNGDIVTVTTADGQPGVQTVVGTPAIEWWPALSPDGRWLTYASNESGRYEIYVRQYPGPGLAEQVSMDTPVTPASPSTPRGQVTGAFSPAWHPNGTGLFFLTTQDLASARFSMMAATFEPGSPPRIGQPRQLFHFDGRELVIACAPMRCYDVASDGEQFYGVKPLLAMPAAPVVTHVSIVQNWFEELKAKVPSQ